MRRGLQKSLPSNLTSTDRFPVRPLVLRPNSCQYWRSTFQLQFNVWKNWCKWSEENSQSFWNWENDCVNLVTTLYNCGPWNTQHIEPSGRWATKGENYVRLHSCQQRTEIWHFSGKSWTTLDSWRLETCGLVWWMWILLSYANSGIRICHLCHEFMDPTRLVSTVQAGGGGVMMRECLLGTL